MKTKFKNGKPVGHIYTAEEHGILLSDIDKDAIHVVKRLNDSGFEAYIVGGAVRDLMLGRKPKDFDVATNASPRQVHRVFRNSRIIGRRFKLVHVVFGAKIIEVSTFRSLQDHEDSNDNIFGTIEEDSHRRDFSIDSLYYSPFDETIIDLTKAMPDFRNKRIRSLIPLNKTFIEDPVRMIRAVKYSVTTGFKMDLSLRFAIKRYSGQLARIGSSRMTEELNKILACGKSSDVIKELNRFGLLVYMLPCFSVWANFQQVYDSLSALDALVAKGKCTGKSQMYYYLVKPLLAVSPDIITGSEFYKDVYRQIKVYITPCTPCNADIEVAAQMYLSENKTFKAKFDNSSDKKKLNQSVKKDSPAKEGADKPHKKRRRRTRKAKSAVEQTTSVNAEPDQAKPTPKSQD